MSKKVTIKELTSKDALFAIKTIEELKTETPKEIIENLDPDYMEAFLSREDYHLIVACSNDESLGFILAYELKRVDRNQKMMFFYEITVHPDFRRQGIGKALIQCLKTLCKKNNILKMWVETNRSNYAAMKLYASTGGIQSKGDDEISFTYYPDYD